MRASRKETQADRGSRARFHEQRLSDANLRRWELVPFDQLLHRYVVLSREQLERLALRHDMIDRLARRQRGTQGTLPFRFLGVANDPLLSPHERQHAIDPRPPAHREST